MGKETTDRISIFTDTNATNLNLEISPVTKMTSRDDISVGADITEILFRSKFTMYIYKGCSVDFTDFLTSII